MSNRQRNNLFLNMGVAALAFVCTSFVIAMTLLLQNLPPISLAFQSSLDPTTTRTPTQPAAKRTPRATLTKPVITVVRVTPTRRPVTPVPTPTPDFKSQTIVVGGDEIKVVDHAILGHPLPPQAESMIPDWYYLYGTTERGTYRVHHGDDFVNPLGTPLIAVANGTVVVAANDADPVCGNAHDTACGPNTDFYGNLVVLRLDTTYYNQPIYALYGHMNSIAVSEGQRVTTGQVIGAVGDTGNADGPHVHLEVRIGVNDYAHTRNPLLWLRPLPGNGIVAGRVVHAGGQPVISGVVDVYNASGSEEIQFTETYGTDQTPPVNPDDDLKENFVLGELPAGNYLLRIEIDGQNYYENLTVADGHLSVVVVNEK